jgi:hypothetical protein
MDKPNITVRRLLRRKGGHQNPLSFGRIGKRDGRNHKLLAGFQKPYYKVGWMTCTQSPTPKDDAMPRRDSRWTSIYGDANAESGFFFYVRLVPSFMDTAAAGHPHGISVGNNRFSTEEQAAEFADSIDAFMEAMILDLRIEEAEKAVENAEADSPLPAIHLIQPKIQERRK